MKHLVRGSNDKVKHVVRKNEAVVKRRKRLLKAIVDDQEMQVVSLDDLFKVLVKVRAKK